jgi:hypothetical protein
MAKTVNAGVPAKKSEALDELNQLALAGKAHEDVIRDQTGGQNSFIKLIGDPQAKELIEGKPEFIKGAKYASFIIGNKKLHLGQKFEATVVGMFKLYEESEVKKEGSKELPKIFGYWMPEDAENIPVEGIFDRPFKAKDGTDHVLKPVHWVALYIHKFPDLEDAVLSFRSVGNGIYNQLAKTIKNQSAMAPQLRFMVKSQAIENKNWEKTNLYPAFEVIGKNFDFADEKIKLIDEDDGGMNVDTLKEVLGRYARLNDEYAANKLVAKKANISALVAGTQAPAGALTANAGKGKAGYRAADDDDEAPTKF